MPMSTYAAPGVYVEEVASAVQAIAGSGTSTAGVIGIFAGDTVPVPSPNPNFDPTQKATERARGAAIVREEAGGPGAVETSPPTPPRRRAEAAATGSNPPFLSEPQPVIAALGEPVLCTSFAEFKQQFGDFSEDDGQRVLAHAVFGFFNNGGRRCYVVRIADVGQIGPALEKFEALDEIALVLAPGVIDEAARAAIVAHCDKTNDRFAILDSPESVATVDVKMLPPTTKNAAFYFPHIQVFDPVAKLRDPTDKGLAFVPPSGHIAGVYARVDATRGVHKAPANEEIRGALGLRYAVTKNQQEGLNPLGVNCIRMLNGSIRIWGARTVGGERNFEYRYVNVRRTMLFLMESIDEGTQWTVFEPNDIALWGKIKRNVSAFLTNVWRDGALFGATAEEAFFVKCDADNNPPTIRELGQVVTEIGVAIVRPAEFVIFRISQATRQSS